MALRWLEGFEGARNVTIFARLYAIGTGTISTEVGQRAGNAIGSNNLDLKTGDLLDGAADENTWVVGYAMRVGAGTFASGATSHPCVVLHSAAGEQLKLEMVASTDSKPGGAYYKLRVVRGATTLATSVDRFQGDLTDLAWTYFEFKATVRTGINGSFSVRYHTRRRKNVTVTWDSASTGVNTANQGADGADRFEINLTNNSTVTLHLDNIYVLDSTGAQNNDMLGEVEIEAIDVSGDGATVQWDLNGGAASLEDAWNEAAATQSTTEDDKRVSTKDVGEIELAALGNPVVIRSVTVVGVQTNLYGKMESSGTRVVQFFYRKTTGTPAQVGTKLVTFNSTSLVGFGDTRQTDPNTSAAWVVADIDGLQVGAELDS